MKAGLPRHLRNAHTMRTAAQIKCKLFFYAISLSALLIAVFPAMLWANNLSISNVTLTSQDSANDTVGVQFDISWDNSWRNQTNWDAVWIFIKYTTETSAPQTWKHAALYKSSGSSETNPSSYSQGSGTELDIGLRNDASSPDRAYGALLYRSEMGNGSVATTSVKLIWNYGANGVADTDSATVKVFGIEMVYVPSGNPYVGDGTVSATDPPGGFIEGGSASYAPKLVNNALGIPLGAATSTNIQSRSGMEVQDDFSSSSTKSLGTNFPKAQVAYYVMKYEVTQGQYAEFLNTLERRAQRNRIASTASADSIADFYVMSAESQVARSYRNTVQAPSVGNGSVNPITFSAGNPYRAMNYMSWMDLAAFADWAAMRPLSELEYEKAARGVSASATIYASAGEYAWGNNFLVAASAIAGDGISNQFEQGTESVSTASANAAFGSKVYTGISAASSGPIRVGIFPVTGAGNRVYAGASFFGIMELSGNVAEQVVTIGNSNTATVTGGRNFIQSALGDGILESGSLCSMAGNATGASSWPGYDSTVSDATNCVVSGGAGVIGARGAMRRGGSWNSVSARLRVSDRYSSSSAGSHSRSSENGGRLMRLAP